MPQGQLARLMDLGGVHRVLMDIVWELAMVSVTQTPVHVQMGLHRQVLPALMMVRMGVRAAMLAITR